MRRQVILDFEYRWDQAGRLQMLCVVARCLESGKVWRQWLGDVESPSPAFPCDTDTVLIAHAIAPAEARCMRVLGWDFSGGWIDTCAEEKVLARGSKPEDGFKLLACCRRRGIPVIADFQKENLQNLCLREGDHDEGVRKRILEYCESDVTATVELFLKIRNLINIPQALLRGRYLAEVSRIEGRGLPVDMSRFQTLKEHGNDGLRQLFAAHFDDHGILDGGSFSHARFSSLVDRYGIGWPRTDSGAYKTDADTLKEMARVHGEPWAGVRQFVKVLRGASIDKLVVTDGGRLVSALRAFGSITGRCAPSTSAYLLNGPKWLRFLLQPPPGRTLLTLDWSNQEFAIVSALSGDEAMLEAYQTGDPYLALAKSAKRVPMDATKQTHPNERAQFKVVSLGVLMGMSEYGIARRLGTDLSRARELLETHHRAFPLFWKWSDATAYTAAADRPLETAFGLLYQPGSGFKPRTARNFLLQATGSDMLRVAVLLLAQKGMEVVTTHHDSVIIECDTCDAEEAGRVAAGCMREASRITLWDRLEVRVEVSRVDHPFHYQDEKGLAYWTRLAGLLNLPLDDHGG